MSGKVILAQSVISICMCHLLKMLVFLLVAKQPRVHLAKERGLPPGGLYWHYCSCVQLKTQLQAKGQTGNFCYAVSTRNSMFLPVDLFWDKTTQQHWTSIKLSVLIYCRLTLKAVCQKCILTHLKGCPLFRTTLPARWDKDRTIFKKNFKLSNLYFLPAAAFFILMFRLLQSILSGSISLMSNIFEYS